MRRSELAREAPCEQDGPLGRAQAPTPIASTASRGAQSPKTDTERDDHAPTGQLEEEEAVRMLPCEHVEQYRTGNDER